MPCGHTEQNGVYAWGKHCKGSRRKGTIARIYFRWEFRDVANFGDAPPGETKEKRKLFFQEAKDIVTREGETL